MSDALIKFQIGPVQDFIAQARSTRDLWSGSYLLSWLMAAGIAKLLEQDGARLIFPNPEGQPLLELHGGRDEAHHTKGVLTPNLPNLFVARVSFEQARKTADEVEKKIRAEWEVICAKCWEALSKERIVEAKHKQRFDGQISRFLSISWQITPTNEKGYPETYRRNGWQLDAVRQTRRFDAWSPGGWHCDSADLRNEKDSLTGKEEAICGGPGWANRAKEGFREPWRSLFKHDDWLGAVTLVKRVWHRAYLEEDPWNLPTDSRHFKIPSTHGIAMHKPESSGDEEDAVETLPGEKYFAVLALDGDQIGKWVSGEVLPKERNLEQHHRDFSSELCKFALEEAGGIVQKHDGRLIYAGGDDVLALLPADTAIECAKKLRTAFQAATSKIEGKGGKPDASVGIAMAHFKSPLQDVIRAAQVAEKTAKKKYERSALAVTVMKRSGEINEWGCKWDSGGLDLYAAVASALDGGGLSAKFPHRAIELLEPYLTPERSKPADAFPDVAGPVIENEFAFVCDRQSLLHDAAKSKQTGELVRTLKKFVESTGQRSEADIAGEKNGTTSEAFRNRLPNRMIEAVTGLCQVVAFAHRTRPEKKSSPQPTK